MPASSLNLRSFLQWADRACSLILPPPPKANRKVSSYGATEVSHPADDSAVAEDEDDQGEEEQVWGNFDFLLLTCALLGAQLTWTIELG